MTDQIFRILTTAFVACVAFMWALYLSLWWPVATERRMRAATLFGAGMGVAFWLMLWGVE